MTRLHQVNLVVPPGARDPEGNRVEILERAGELA
jgi:hypothetical protein